MSCRDIGFVLTALIVGLPAWAEDPTWPAKQFDPSPATTEADKAQELSLPMPCGGAMVFRRINVVPGDGWLHDEKIRLGSAADARYAFKENQRDAYIAGTFTESLEDSISSRFYYLGKYEVTQLQFDSLDNTCPEVKRKGRRPVVEVSWFDAVDFTRRYTEWLYENALDLLPVEDGVPGYLRLPTEAEWEYAARGGLKVDSTAFHSPLFPPLPAELMSDYVWYDGTESSDGRLRPIGQLKPNPLNLYDLLGNASEIVLNPFHLDKHDHMHGQAGGFLVKGGDFRTNGPAIRTSFRNEYPHFDQRTGRVTRPATAGFRIAISGPVLTSDQRAEMIREEWKNLPSELVNKQREHDDPFEELHAVMKASNEQAVKQRLGGISQQLKVELSRWTQEHGRAARFLIKQAAITGKRISDLERWLKALGKQVSKVKSTRTRMRELFEKLSDEERERKREQFEEAERRFTQELEPIEARLTFLLERKKGNLLLYADTIYLVESDYTDEVMENELGNVKATFLEREAHEIQSLVPYAELFVAHAQQYREKPEDPEANLKSWLDDIQGI